ncbi:MAG: ATP-binding protein, partial [Candidatus Omnitrophica bacterium]|nr:ATP-binding protein [Candidatus Omnitrophota bacterium]
MKKFDLNIEKVLEDWEAYHAIREVIANALDEQAITNTKDIEISQDQNGWWHIRDFGRGLKYEHLTQNENEEKLLDPHLIGKFGVGLKDALATFDRKGVKVNIKSRHGDISFGKSQKHEFEDIITLHAYISEAVDVNLEGTEFILEECSKGDIDKAKNLFLKFSGERIIDTTQYGQILEKMGQVSKIYINGVLAAEEEDFLFSFNITSITKAIKKALNRERTNVGRAAYSDRIKAILLASKEKEVAKKLVEDLKEYETGKMHDEVKWTDVSVQAVKQLNESEKVIFFTPNELTNAPEIVDKAKDDGYKIVAVPDNVKEKISGQTDISGNPIMDVAQFQKDYNDSFKFKFVEIKDLDSKERFIFAKTSEILDFIGGKPNIVKEIKISETMRPETYRITEAVGTWDQVSGTIIIKRTQLESIEKYAGTLLHEIAHALSGATDVSREFEKFLTDLIGKIVSIL